MNCKSCRREFSSLKTSYGFCKNNRCQKEKTIWLKANFDLMEDCNFKSKYENEFWEVTPEQKKEFATFYSLMKTPPAPKKRKCLRCRKTFLSFKRGRENYRICEDCHRVNAKIGTMANGGRILSINSQMSGLLYIQEAFE